MFQIIILFILFLSFTQNNISENQAIKIAEDFVKINGYTISNGDTSKLVFEFMERSTDKIEILKYRKNMLESKAYGIFKGQLRNKNGWTVAFKYTNPNYKSGRAITMDSVGLNIKIQHKDLNLEMFKKL